MQQTEGTVTHLISLPEISFVLELAGCLDGRVEGRKEEKMDADVF